MVQARLGDQVVVVPPCSAMAAPELQVKDLMVATGQACLVIELAGVAALVGME